MSTEWFKHLKKDYVQGFPAYCGFEVQHVAHGKFETRLKLRAEHRQQDGFVHAGVMATMADHTAGYAAFTTVSENHRILTIEFKINYLKPATGESIVCRSRVINDGQTVIVAESEIFTVTEGKEKQVAKALVTLFAVTADKLAKSRG